MGWEIKVATITVDYTCDGEPRWLKLNAERIKAMYFDHCERIAHLLPGSWRTLNTEDEWENCKDELEGVVLDRGSGAWPNTSGDCLCFKKDDGTWYCVCSM